MSAIEGMEEIALVLTEVLGVKIERWAQQIRGAASVDAAALKAWGESVAEHIRNAPSPDDALAVHGETAQPNEPPKDGGGVAP